MEVMYEKKNKELTLIPKYELYMQYMLEIILLKLPRTEKYSIGNEFKSVMYDTFKDIVLNSYRCGRKLECIA